MFPPQEKDGRLAPYPLNHLERRLGQRYRFGQLPDQRIFVRSIDSVRLRRRRRRSRLSQSLDGAENPAAFLNVQRLGFANVERLIGAEVQVPEDHLAVLQFGHRSGTGCRALPRGFRYEGTEKLSTRCAPISNGVKSPHNYFHCWPSLTETHWKKKSSSSQRRYTSSSSSSSSIGLVHAAAAAMAWPASLYHHIRARPREKLNAHQTKTRKTTYELWVVVQFYEKKMGRASTAVRQSPRCTATHYTVCRIRTYIPSLSRDVPRVVSKGNANS